MKLYGDFTEDIGSKQSAYRNTVFLIPSLSMANIITQII